VPAGLPDYYTELRPFRELFETGLPLLTYHKVGPRPRGVRLKGLYVSPRLFARQMAELGENRFLNASLDEVAKRAGHLQRRIVITFDDGWRNVFEHALEPLAKNRLRAIHFLVADLLGRTNEWDLPAGEVQEPIMDSVQVRDWLASGHEIGSHTLTHPFLTRLPRAAAREEISASKKKLEDLFGRPIAHFCYPYGDWNPQIRDLAVESGYRTACTTDFGVNSADVSLFELKRITARYPSRNWKSLREWLRPSRR
jgi:peptidoglycan/xylan/chitin deacetylase (PgdA/CDA1 family)